MLFRSASIPNKMMLLACGSSAIALVLACCGFTWHSVNVLRDVKGRQLRDQAEIIAFQAGPSIVLRDQARGLQLLESLQSDATLEEARLYNNEGALVAAWGNQQQLDAPPQRTPGYHYLGLSHVEVVHPVVIGQQQLGTVFLRANTTDLQQQLREFASIAGLVLALAMSMVIVVSGRLQRPISGPILALTKAAELISLNADRSIRVTGHADAELKTLQAAFNRMLDDVQRSELALQTAQNELESRVVARTKELSTEIRRRQEFQVELESAKEAAEAASQAKTDFLANMSHEIRTPLNGILGFTDVMLNDTYHLSADEQRDYLTTIRNSGAHLVRLINDILDVSKIEAGRLELEYLPCSPQQIIGEVVAALSVQAREKGLQLECDVASNLPQMISSDPNRLRQLLINLVGNAIKFTEQGSIRVVAGLSPQSSRKLQLDVIDTGMGIPREKLDMIFDPFSQADTSVTRRFGGTGLGLAISRKIAETLGGQLTVQSEVGVGSRFQAIIDLGEPITDAAACVRQELPNTALAEPAHAGDSLVPYRILVVDDGDTNRKLIQLILTRAGATVLSAENGLESLRATDREHPDLILMDMQMPVLDGYSATRELRARGLTVPIIALTAHAMKGDEEKCRAAGCTGYLTKPVEGPRLLACVARQLGHPVEVPIAKSDFTAPPCNATTRERPSPTPITAAAIYSVLPTDDADFCEIIAEFVERLQGKLTEMRQAHNSGDFSQLACLAHWLKGSGGTAGFGSFTEPARQLETAAAAQDAEACGNSLAVIDQLAARLVVPVIVAP